jgi:hypothetical protein
MGSFQSHSFKKNILQVVAVIEILKCALSLKKQQRRQATFQSGVDMPLLD